MEALDVQNGDATPADLNKTGMLEGALDQIDGGSLDAKHLSEKFLRQPDVIASQPFTALEKPPCCATLNLMERLAGSRLLRLREQGQVEQRNDLSETLAGFPDAVDLRSRDAHSFACDLNDAFGKRSHNAVDNRRTDHSLSANDGGLGGLALFGACEDGDDGGSREVGEFDN